ncbi:phytochelatin synthase family protein [Vibrio jasicida]|uniref:phytochelatin synthase family protein n=1 Tax=Vibrio jasicida TaxID=766224 RepID=UPI000CE2D583|nr:phytochelatin synthase family protein [Vibrio jasicida]
MNTDKDKNVVVRWDTEESLVRLVNAEHKRDFPRLAMFYQAQDNKMFCGVAAGAIVLNALRVGKVDEIIPLDTSTVSCHEMGYMAVGFVPHWNRYSQDTILTTSGKSRIEILGKPYEFGAYIEHIYGLHLFEFVEMMHANSAYATHVKVENGQNYETVKADIIKALDRKNHYVVAYFCRKALNQNGSGHFSPIAAYDSNSDSFLLLDTNNVSNHWSWIDANKLIEAMNTFDGYEYRGYSVVSD